MSEQSTEQPVEPTTTDGAAAAPASAVTPAEDAPDRHRNFHLDSLMNTFSVGLAEAEHIYDRVRGGENAEDVANEVKGGRVIYRQRFEQVDGALGNPPNVVGAEAGGRTLEEIPGDPTAPTLDSTQPESGPYGPYADYAKPEVSDAHVAERSGVDPESGKKVS